MHSKTLKHSTLFIFFTTAILFVEINLIKYKLLFLCILPLIFLFLHFKFFTKNFTKEFIFVVCAFFIGFIIDLILPNMSVFHFGLVDSSGFKFPPPWITSLWMIFPAYLVTSVKIFNKYKLIGAYFGATFLLAFYYIVGEHFDLVFFEKPKNKSFIVFILTWYLAIRSLFLVNKVLTEKIKAS